MLLSFSARRVTAAVMLTGLSLGASILATTPAHADTTTNANWWCERSVNADDGDPGGRSIKIFCGRAGTANGLISAEFRAKGEHVAVGDKHANGRNAIAYLSVKDFAPPEEFGPGNHNTSYPDGKGVQLRLCTSDTAGAVCGTVNGGIT